MKKYILSAAIALTLATSALAGKDNTHIACSIGPTLFFAEQVFNQKINNQKRDRDNIFNYDTENNGELTTTKGLGSLLDHKIISLDHKIISSFSYNIYPSTKFAVEFSFINPVNNLFKGLISSEYKIEELSLLDVVDAHKSHFEENTILKEYVGFNKNPQPFSEKPQDDFNKYLLTLKKYSNSTIFQSLLFSIHEADKKWQAQERAQAQAQERAQEQSDYNQRSQNLNQEEQNNFYKEGVSDDEDESEKQNYQYNYVKKEPYNGTRFEEKISNKQEPANIQLFLKNFTVKQSVTASFVNIALYQTTNIITNNFSWYFGGKLGFGNLDIKQEMTEPFDVLDCIRKLQKIEQSGGKITLISITASQAEAGPTSGYEGQQQSKQTEPSVTKQEPQDLLLQHPPLGLVLTTNQKGYTLLLTLAAGATGTLESLPGVQCSIDFNLSVYGNLDKKIQYEVYRYNETTGNREEYVDNFKQNEYNVNTAGNQSSWFGPIDASISVGVKINL